MARSSSLAAVLAFGGEERVRVVGLVVGVATAGDRRRKRETSGLVVATTTLPVLQEGVVLGLAEAFEGLAGEGLEGRLALARLAGGDIRQAPRTRPG